MADVAWFFGIWIVAAFLLAPPVGRRMRSNRPTNRRSKNRGTR